MKSLILSQLGNCDDALALIKKTLANLKNFKNASCWHVMGCVQRKRREYDLARKAILTALKHNPENDSYYRELFQLQLHLRDFPGF